jgi:hypothetical protein
MSLQAFSKAGLVPLPVIVIWILLMSVSVLASVTRAEETNDTLTSVFETDESLEEDDILEISYVMEPFDEWIPSLEGSFADATYLAVANNTNNALFGTEAIRVQYTNLSQPASFGWILPVESPPHSCFGANRLSFWIKKEEWVTDDVLAPEDGISVELLLLDDTACTSNCSLETNLLSVSIAQHEFLARGSNDTRGTTTEDWTEVSVFLDPNTNTRINLGRIRGWKVTISPTNDTSSLLSGSFLIDHLACYGDGSLLGDASMYLPESTEFSQAVSENIWEEVYFQSEESQNNTDVILENGVFSVNYTIEMVETWGGFVQFTRFAPGHAYFNLSKATDLTMEYSVNIPSSKPNRAIFRLVLSYSSDCQRGCEMESSKSEKHYSFHSILDDDSSQQALLFIPLESSTEPGKSFWLTGWSGITGNSKLDPTHIKGYTFEFVLDSQLDFGETASGSVSLSHLSAVYSPRDEGPLNCTVDDSGVCISPLYEGLSVAEPLLTIDVFSTTLRRIEFVGNRCRDVCERDPSCIYATTNGRDCFVGASLDAADIQLKATGNQLRNDRVYWVDDDDKRGDFCERCLCNQALLLIDCRGQNLTIVPKIFSAIGWLPETLDLRENPSLSLLGSGSLSQIAERLTNLYLPADLIFISFWALEGLSNLQVVEMERTGDGQVRPGQFLNAISNPADSFGNVCCGPTDDFLQFSFCDMSVHSPGVDSVYFPFTIFEDAVLLMDLRPSSEFLAEGSNSVEKCAEICTIIKECRGFTYDARLPNAEHSCLLFSSDGIGTLEICCDSDHYADENATIPGYISGLPPATRNDLDSARVLVSEQLLVVDKATNYEAIYSITLGSSPLRGAVWVEPRLRTKTTLEVSIHPTRVSLYEANKTVEVIIKIGNITKTDSTASLLIENHVESCDSAFLYSAQGESQDFTVFLDVILPDSEDTVNLAVAIAVPLLSAVALILVIAFFLNQKMQKNDAIWLVRPDDLQFKDPPEILGRGTFGLVVAAEYRGK